MSSISIEEETPSTSSAIFENDQNNDHNDHIDQSPLLGESIDVEVESDCEDELTGTANYLSCTVNLANTILGTGMLAMPAAVASVDFNGHTSFIALIAVVYFGILLLFIIILDLIIKAPPKEKIALYKIFNEILYKLRFFIFAFTCHQNVFSIYNEHIDNSQASITENGYNILLPILVSKLDLVLAFVGSTGSTTISFIITRNILLQNHEK
ncbi:unnamed protein product [Rhizophagus irregularis]|nr:unnamed protein product [Rhizophagus irregularis]